jgi:hypothetical protein
MTRLQRLELAADLQRAYVESLADCQITVNTEGVVTSHWPAWEAREFLLAPSAPAPVVAALDSLESPCTGCGHTPQCCTCAG